MKDAPPRFHSDTLMLDSSRDYVDDLYRQYQADPSSVSDDWQIMFAQLDNDLAQHTSIAPTGNFQPMAGTDDDVTYTQSLVLRMINAYRYRGHLKARIDPIGVLIRPDIPDLDPAFYQLTEADMETTFHTGSMFAPEFLPLREIIDRLSKAYTGSIGAEYMHISDTPKKRWIQARLE
ncbi:MAG: hypothetical protein WBN49_00265, partial [Arenicellales bacterium]